MEQGTRLGLGSLFTINRMVATIIHDFLLWIKNMMNEKLYDNEILSLNKRIQELEEKVLLQNREIEDHSRKNTDMMEILNMIAVPVIAIDKNYKLRFGNARAWEIMDLPKEVVEELNIWESPTLPPEEKRKVTAIVERMVKGETPVVEELWTYIDLEKRLIRWTHDIAKDESGSMRFFTATGTDITDLWHTSQKLNMAKELAEESTLRKDRFIAILSHDLRAPLLSVGFLMKLLKDNVSISKEEMTSLLGQAITSCAGMVEMINNILDMSRLKKGILTLNKRNIGTRKIIEKIIHYFEEYKAYKGITIENTLSETHTVYADQMQLEIVLRNLLSNAIKFCSKGNNITIHSPENRNNYITIKNSGIDIKKEFLPHLFDEVILTTSPGTWGEVGSGFGLPLCKEIIDSHQGSIDVSSKDSNTEFLLYFPSDIT